MKRSIIFVATADPVFENVAIDAALDSYHGVRPVHSVWEACRILSSGTENIAVAIIDLSLHEGLILLEMLGSSEPNFPILAVVEDEEILAEQESIESIAVCHLTKPVDTDVLRSKIESICEETLIRNSSIGSISNHAGSSETGRFHLAEV